MTRVIHADVITELAKPSFRTARLIKIDFALPVFLCDFYQDIIYNSNTYEAGGQLIGIPSINETSAVRVSSVSLNLSGVHQSTVSTILSENTVDRKVTMYRAVIDDSGVIIGNPIMIYEGRLTKFGINDTDNTSTVSLTIANHWGDFELKAGRKTNDNSQRMFFNSDAGMAFSGLMTKDVKWGRL